MIKYIFNVHINYYRLRLTNDRPDLSSERVPHRDKKKKKESNFPTENFGREIMSGQKPRVGLTPRHTN
jgi:hypothetical protein